MVGTTRHGGRRPGSGRKARIRFGRSLSLWLSAEVCQYLREKYGAGKSRQVDEWIRRSKAFRRWQEDVT